MSIDRLLIQYLETFITQRDAGETSKDHLWWNNAIIFIQEGLAVNEDFTLWLRDKFNDQATADAFIDSFNEFVKGDLDEKS